MSNIPTPHIECSDLTKIAKTVLMPGDPLRAKYIAENFLENVICFNTVRNVLGYTGYYKDKKVSVMASGMGMPSIGIYSYELYSFYGVENIIRIGSAGSYTPDLHIFDITLVSSAYTESSYGKVFNDYSDTLCSSDELNNKIILAAKNNNIDLKLIKCHSSDNFYRMNDDYLSDIIDFHGCQVVEMESYALFANAKALNKHAACLLTISDSFVSNEAIDAKDREVGFNNMIKLALESI
ncbi:MAG: purine-nucleoside phosphorylase [Anaeroplasmataceae bacterium]